MNAEFAEMVQVLLVFGSILTDRFVTQNYHDIFGLGAWGEQVGVEVEVVFEGGVHVEMGNGGCTACFGGVGAAGGGLYGVAQEVEAAGSYHGSGIGGDVFAGTSGIVCHHRRATGERLHFGDAVALCQ